MIVAIHQPHFLPWLGYLDRMIRADLFIVLDHVQFERRNYQNRTRIRLDGRNHWLTVPVQQHSRYERIVDKRIDNPAPGVRHRWGADHARTLRHAYRDAPFLDRYAPALTEILESHWTHLVDLDLAMLGFLRNALAIGTPIVRSSELAAAGTKSELILNLCRAVDADTYLAGMGGSRDYLDRAAFARAGIDIAWQDFRHPRYPQWDGSDFIAGLSAIDLLFNHGPMSRGLMREKAVVAPPRAALDRRELSYS